MTNKETKKRRQELVKAAEEKQYGREIAKMPISRGDLKALLEFLARPHFLHCDHTLKETLEFLDTHHLDKVKILPWLNEYGGFCDCEVVFNVGDSWGEYVGVSRGNDDVEEKTSKQKGQKQERLILDCGLKLLNIPKQWKLFVVNAAEDAYRYMQFGKKGNNLRLTIIETALPEGDRESEGYWIQQWTQLTNLPLKRPCVVEKEQVSLSHVSLKTVTVMNPDWLPVYRWILSPDGKWYMRAETTLERKQDDFRELSNLLGKMELT